MLLTLLIAAAALWCLWTSGPDVAPEHAHSPSSVRNARSTWVRPASHVSARLRAHDLPPSLPREREVAAPADHLLFLQ